MDIFHCDLISFWKYWGHDSKTSTTNISSYHPAERTIICYYNGKENVLYFCYRNLFRKSLHIVCWLFFLLKIVYKIIILKYYGKLFSIDAHVKCLCPASNKQLVLIKSVYISDIISFSKYYYCNMLNYIYQKNIWMMKYDNIEDFFTFFTWINWPTCLTNKLLFVVQGAYVPSFILPSSNYKSFLFFLHV